MKFLKRIKKLVSKKPFKPGDRVRCPTCDTVMTLIKMEDKKCTG